MNNTHTPLTIDDIQERLESFLGMSLRRENIREWSCLLVADSPTGVMLFKIEIYCTPERGWHYAGHGYLLSESQRTLMQLHLNDENPSEISPKP